MLEKDNCVPVPTFSFCVVFITSLVCGCSSGSAPKSAPTPTPTRVPAVRCKCESANGPYRYRPIGSLYSLGCEWIIRSDVGDLGRHDRHQPRFRSAVWISEPLSQARHRHYNANRNFDLSSKLDGA
jgi:hypothetical protein